MLNFVKKSTLVSDSTTLLLPLPPSLSLASPPPLTPSARPHLVAGSSGGARRGGDGRRYMWWQCPEVCTSVSSSGTLAGGGQCGSGGTKEQHVPTQDGSLAAATWRSNDGARSPRFSPLAAYFW
jgi:hypothetical protein